MYIQTGAGYSNLGGGITAELEDSAFQEGVHMNS